MASRFCSGDHENIDSGLNLFYRMFLCADESGNRDIVELAHFKHIPGWNAQGIGDQFNWVREGDINNICGPALS